MRHKLETVVVLAALLGAPNQAGAVVSGGCGSAGGADDFAVNPQTGDLVTVGMEQIGVHRGGVSNVDYDRISLYYGGDVLTPPEGDRFAIRQGKTVYLYDFSTFERIGKTSVRVLKDQSIWAYTWLPGSDDIVILGAVVKSTMFDTKTTRSPNLLHINVASGTGSLIPLQPADDFRTAVFDESGTRMALSFKDGHIEILSTTDGSLLARYQVHEAEQYYGLGMAFHPNRNVLVSTDSNRLVYYDLDADQPEAVYSGIEGGWFLRFVAQGQHLVIGGQNSLAFADLEGRTLEAHGPSSDDYYSAFRVAEPLQKVFTLGNELVCWRSFQKWQRVATKAEEAAALELPGNGGEVVFKGQPLSHYVAQLNDDDFTTRLLAFQNLQSIGPAAAPAVPELMRVLEGDEPARKEDEPSLIGPAMATLGTIGPAAEPAVPRVAGFLDSDNADVRRAAVLCLLKLGPSARAAVPQLTGAIRDPAIDVQMAAIQALAAIGPDARSALPALEALRKEGGRMKAIASAAIEKIEE